LARHWGSKEELECVGQAAVVEWEPALEGLPAEVAGAG
jgi:hypothetical protein